MKTKLILVLLLTSNLSQAQIFEKKAMSVQVGYGLSTPFYSDKEIVNDGFFLQGEYVLSISSWVEIRPYAGLIVTSSNGKDLNGNPTDEKAETKAFIIGGKARLILPIPYVAPYVEFGLGSSIGKFETFTAYTDVKKSGVLYHIPISVGLKLGQKKGIDLGFSYIFQPTVEQFSGAFAFGITIPLKS